MTSSGDSASVDLHPGGPEPGRSGPRGHFVLCGGGVTGQTVVNELANTGRSFVVIERNAELCAQLRERLPDEVVIEGDATDEEVLLRAGVADAQALMTTLLEDKLNLVVVVTALQLNPALRVVSRGTEQSQWDRLRRAGAVVVAPAHIGGRRLATGMIHPDATVFLNEMLSSPSEIPIRVEAVVVESGSEGCDRTLAELDVYRRTGLQVVAVRKGETGPFLYNPGNQTRLASGDRLLVIGDWHSVDKLATLVGRWE